MKNLYLFICLTLFFFSGNLPASSQDANIRKFNSDQPLFFIPKSHDPNFLKSAKLSTRSFYQRKSDWQHIIDSTWGPGDSLSRKLLIYNTYTKAIHNAFDGFNSLKLNWDSLYNRYQGQINDSTSKGAFSSIMSHFAYEFKDHLTKAFDSTVVMTPLNPGVPILVLGNYLSVEHFGAVTTVLPDSTTLVLRAVPDHPLNLEPGDIILGYEGVPWKNLVKELFDAGLPLLATPGACKSANAYHKLMGVGLNWHLFNTIDVLKYSTGETLHLSLLPMISLNVPPMANNEQLPIRNIPFPDVLPDPIASDTVVTYGILENSNTGYIFLAKENGLSELQFFNAVNALQNTDALIIDMRLNFGGNVTHYENAFNILFNETHKTIQDALRCNPNSFELCPAGNWANYEIRGLGPDYYDRPIAVLLGPSCMNWSELTPQRLRYHPMVRFFGTSPSASFGGYAAVGGFPDWYMYYSNTDMMHVSQPTDYLNRKEFPIDYPVWFNKDDVAKGIDPIVAKSLEWISNLAYGHDIVTDEKLYSSSNDTVKINAIIENPNSHDVTARLIFEKLDGSVVDSTEMNPLKLDKENDWQGIWETKGLPENMYWISLNVTDQTDGSSFTNKHMTRITTVPLWVDSLPCTYSYGSDYTFQPHLKNGGKILQISNITVDVSCTDPWVKSVYPSKVKCSPLKPLQVRRTPSFEVRCNTNPFPGYFNLKLSISTDGWTYWVKDTTVKVTPTAIQPEQSLPLVNSLDQNYPNPFNSSTTISWQLARRSWATLKVFDLVGREVAIPVDEQRPAGKYETEINAATMPKGVYFYQLRAGDFIQTRKMILVK